LALAPPTVYVPAASGWHWAKSDTGCSHNEATNSTIKGKNFSCQTDFKRVFIIGKFYGEKSQGLNPSKFTKFIAARNEKSQLRAALFEF
jgi:hypothetical protein